MVTELLILFALVAANGLFAGAEIAVLTTPRAAVQTGVNNRSRRARAVHKLREQPERFLATVQIGITVVGAAAAAFGGARIAADLTPHLEPLFGRSAGEVAMVAVVAFVAFLSLVLGELVPKSLALRYSKGYAFLIGRPLLGLARIMRPLVWFLTACSNAVLKLFGDKTSFTESRVSRDEIRELVNEAAKTGSVDAKSSEIATRALEYGDVLVSEVMVRRDRVATLARDAPAEEVRTTLLQGYSRLPVIDGSIDRIIGYVVVRDVLAHAWQNDDIDLETVIRPILFCALTSRVSAVLREMQARRSQIAVVVDEAGGTAGIVTLEDLVEELIGDVFGENELPDETLRIEPDGSALVPGWLPTRKVNRALDTALPIARESTTIAGLCMALALTIPGVGTKLTAPDGTLIEVVEASARRVLKVRIHRREKPTDDPDAESATSVR